MKGPKTNQSVNPTKKTCGKAPKNPKSVNPSHPQNEQALTKSKNMQTHIVSHTHVCLDHAWLFIRFYESPMKAVRKQYEQ